MGSLTVCVVCISPKYSLVAYPIVIWFPTIYITLSQYIPSYASSAFSIRINVAPIFAFAMILYPVDGPLLIDNGLFWVVTFTLSVTNVVILPGLGDAITGIFSKTGTIKLKPLSINPIFIYAFLVVLASEYGADTFCIYWYLYKFFPAGSTEYFCKYPVSW